MKTLPPNEQERVPHTLLDKRGMAALLNISPRTLANLSRSGKIKAIKLNRRLHRYDAERVINSLNQMEAA
jgi:predicted site-specific integrase-resolvase